MCIKSTDGVCVLVHRPHNTTEYITVGGKLWISVLVTSLNLDTFDCRLKFSNSSDEEAQESSSDHVDNYDDDPELPLFSSVSSGYPASELARILMNQNIDPKRVCHVQPLGVTKNATFIVGIDDVLFIDLKADDLGTWMNNGTKSTYFTMLPNGLQVESLVKV